jgi:hypothetical protein
LKPEAERYLEKARQALNEARAVAGIELSEAAGVEPLTSRRFTPRKR